MFVSLLILVLPTRLLIQKSANYPRDQQIPDAIQQKRQIRGSLNDAGGAVALRAVLTNDAPRLAQSPLSWTLAPLELSSNEDC